MPREQDVRYSADDSADIREDARHERPKGAQTVSLSGDGERKATARTRRRRT